MVLKRAGELAFFIVVLIAIVGGILLPSNGAMILALVVLGLVVGVLNISEKETLPYLVAAIALLAVGTASFKALDSLLPPVGTLLDNIVRYVTIFVAPAAVIVALKSIWGLARTK